MNFPVLIEENKARITLPSKFNMSAQADFRKTYSSVLADQSVNMIEIDFAAVDYIDSHTLGNLLLMRQCAGGRIDRIRLSKCNSEVIKTLAMANFQRIFDVG